MEDFLTILSGSVPKYENCTVKKAKEKGLYKTQIEAIKALGVKIAPFISRESDSFTLEKVGE